MLAPPNPPRLLCFPVSPQGKGYGKHPNLIQCFVSLHASVGAEGNTVGGLYLHAGFFTTSLPTLKQNLKHCSAPFASCFPSMLPPQAKWQCPPPTQHRLLSIPASIPLAKTTLLPHYSN